MRIVSLYRYPVKGLSPERQDKVLVTPNEGFPHDRRYALLRTDVDFDPTSPVWLAKANFLMLMLHEKLATLHSQFDETTNTLFIHTPDDRKLLFSLNDTSDRKKLETFFKELMPEKLQHPPRLLEAAGHMFSDKQPKYVSLINLASIRELEQRWGETLDPLRFRANIYIDGVEPFSELEWIGQRVSAGEVTMNVMQRNGRCAATNVNPETGTRDRNIPGKLRSEFGHKDLGIYLTVTQSGELHEGDTINFADLPTKTGATLHVSDHKNASLICTACYYLFDPTELNKNWHQPQDLPLSWQCPDCGAHRECIADIRNRPRI